MAFKRESDSWESDGEDVGVIDYKTSHSRRLCVAAIEFCTTYYRFGYSWRHDWTNVLSFKGRVDLTYKAPTALLLNPDKSFCKLGFGAEEEYKSLVEENKHRDYFFFRQFTSIFKPNHTDSMVCCNAF